MDTGQGDRQMAAMPSLDYFPLVTDRLTLRPIRAADFPAYAAYHGRADVYRFLYAAPPQNQALEAQFMDAAQPKFAQDGDVFRLAVTLTGKDEMIGEVLLKLANQSAAQGEVGYIFNPAWAGHGYAVEAAEALVRVGFEQGGLHRIFARLDAANAGSVALMQRLGFRREAHLIQNDCFDGVWGDEFIYALLRSEWMARPA